MTLLTICSISAIAVAALAVTPAPAGAAVTPDIKDSLCEGAKLDLSTPGARGATDNCEPY